MNFYTCNNNDCRDISYRICTYLSIFSYHWQFKFHTKIKKIFFQLSNHLSKNLNTCRTSLNKKIWSFWRTFGPQYSSCCCCWLRRQWPSRQSPFGFEHGHFRFHLERHNTIFELLHTYIPSLVTSIPWPNQHHQVQKYTYVYNGIFYDEAVFNLQRHFYSSLRNRQCWKREARICDSFIPTWW